MKKRFGTRFLSVLLTFCLVLGMFPVMTAQAAETVAPGDFNASNGNLEYIFGYNTTQYANIEVLVRETGKLETEVSLGLIAEEVMVYGAEGSELGAKEPEYNNMPATPGRTPKEKFYSDIASLTKGDYYDSETGEVDGGGNPITAPACETKFTWDGRIDGIPILGPDPTQDTFEVVLITHTLGDITKGCTACEDDDEGTHTHGENYLWTDTDEEWSNPRTVIKVDYRTFLDQFLSEEGKLQSMIQSMMEGSFSNDILKQMLQDCLADNHAPQYLKDLLVQVLADPIYMATGAYASTYTDMRLEGGVPLTFLRAYNSRYTSGSLGQGFTHGYEYSLRDDNGILRVTMPGGEEIIFLRLRDGGYDSLQGCPFLLADDGSGGYVMTHNTGARFLFNSVGKLTEIVNPSDITVASFTYDGGGQLTDIDGVAGSFILDWAGGHIVQVTDSAGRSTQYAYSGENLISVTNTDGDTQTFDYDGNGYLSSVTDFEGEEYVRNTYDDIGRVTEQVFINAGKELTATFSYSDQGTDGGYTVTAVDFYGRERVYHYDKHRELQKIVEADGTATGGYDQFVATAVTDKQGNTTTYDVDDLGYITAIHHADGGVTSITYNGNHLPIKVTDQMGEIEHYTYTGGSIASYTNKNGNTTSYTYNSLGLMDSQTDAAGSVTSYAYDGQGRMTVVSYPNGGQTSYSYDAVGRITSTTVKINDTESASTRYEYTDGGKLSKVIDALGNETAYKYNANGFTTSTTDALGGVTSTEYGTNGQPLSVTDANGNTTTYTYNDEGLLFATTDAMGNATRYFYDEKALLTRTEDADGNATRYEYDSLERLVKTTDALGGETSYEYDAMGRTTSVTDAEGNTTEYSYDKLGRTVKVTDALSGKTTYIYDPNSNLLETKDANGNTTSSSYDPLNRVIAETDAEGNVTAYAYDTMGRVRSVTDANDSVTSYTYDYVGNLLTQTDAEGNTTAFRYDLLGRKVEQINADNSSKTFSYDALGNLLQSKDELGHITAYTYDHSGNVLTVTDPRGNATAYSYNVLNQTDTITYADGGTMRYTYNSRGLTASVTDQRGFVTAYTYDELGRTASTTDAVGATASYTYDGLGNLLTTAVNGSVTQNSSYDALNRRISVADGLGNDGRYEYDKVGTLLAYTDREGNKTRYAYNKNYTLLSVTDAEGGMTAYELDAVGNTLKVMDANGNATGYAYDGNYNLLTTTDALGTAVSNTYDAMGRVISATDKLGATTAYTYDAAGNLLSVTDMSAKTTRYTYDENNNLTSTTSRLNEKTSYVYDAMNRMVKETNQLNHASEYEYDLAGNRVGVIDGNKDRTEYAYDGLNRLISETNAEGGKVAYAFDPFGNTASVTTDGGNGSKAVTSYAYDLAGNLLTETDAAGAATAYTYNKEGSVLTKTDRNGQTTSSEYDKLYRLTGRTDADGTVSYSYDAVGNMASASDAAGTVGFSYDALSRTTAVTNEDSTTTNYGYDPAGNRTAITYPDGKAVSTAYDLLGRVTALTDHDGTATRYDRDAEGKIIKEYHPDGSTTEYAYNNIGQLVEQKEVTAANATLRKITYAYDDAGNLTMEQRSGVDVDKKDENVRYYYDGANQLVRTVIEGKTTNYTYDLAGNLLSDGEATYTYDTQNRLLTKSGLEGTTTYTYDAAGNLLKKDAPDGSTEYTYTAQNKLAEGKTDDGQSSTYTYNALGVRISNVQVRNNQNSGYANADLSNGSTHIKDYLPALSDDRADWQRVWESEVGSVHQNDLETVTTHYTVDYLSMANRDIMVTEDGSWTARYVYDESSTRISAEFDYADGTARGTTNANGEYGENPASDIAVGDISKVWYRTSLLGSTLYAVDKDGKVVSHAIYDPWGQPLTGTYTDTNFSGIDNLNNFTGYTWDEVLGLYYAQNRFYDAETHRFTQEDPIKNGANWYVYCGNSPINTTDPLGESWSSAWDSIKSWGTDVANWGKEKIEQAKSWIKEQVQSLIASIANYTKHFTDSARWNDVQFGMVSAALISVGDSGAMLLQALINTGKILSGKLPDTDYFKDYLKSSSAINTYFASKCAYKDSYYFGKMLGDIIVAANGIGLTAKSIFDMLAGAGMTGIGSATAPTGVGVGVAALGVALTAEGVATVTVGVSMAAAAVNNFGGDKSDFDYYQKLACEKLNSAWKKVLDNSTKVRNTKGSTHIYDRNSGGGYSQAKADFDSLGLSNVEIRSNGTITGKTADGKTVNLHTSSTDNGRWTLEYGNYKIRY